MISCMTMIFTLHFTLNNFCEPQKYEHFLSKMFFKAYYRIILRKFGRKFLSLNKSSKKEKYFFHLWSTASLNAWSKRPIFIVLSYIFWQIHSLFWLYHFWVFSLIQLIKSIFSKLNQKLTFDSSPRLSPDHHLFEFS